MVCFLKIIDWRQSDSSITIILQKPPASSIGTTNTNFALNSQANFLRLSGFQSYVFEAILHAHILNNSLTLKFHPKFLEITASKATACMWPRLTSEESYTRDEMDGMREEFFRRSKEHEIESERRRKEYRERLRQKSQGEGEKKEKLQKSLINSAKTMQIAEVEERSLNRDSDANNPQPAKDDTAASLGIPIRRRCKITFQYKERAFSTPLRESNRETEREWSERKRKFLKINAEDMEYLKSHSDNIKGICYRAEQYLKSQNWPSALAICEYGLTRDNKETQVEGIVFLKIVQAKAFLGCHNYKNSLSVTEEILQLMKKNKDLEMKGLREEIDKIRSGIFRELEAPSEVDTNATVLNKVG